MDGEPFRPGERVILVDDRDRPYMIRLERGGTFHFHGGAVPHDQVIGVGEGGAVRSGTGSVLLCFRPRLADFILKMARGAQIIYPKDLGAILVYADVFAGARVLEAGTGSGALTLTLARAVGTEGRVVSYEIRPHFYRVARSNVVGYFGKLPSWVELRLGDVREVAETGETYHRALLDLPEPWAVLSEIAETLLPGGILCGYLPTAGQVQTLGLSLEKEGFSQVETFEVLLRTWHVASQSVRPDHRMVAHTGFVTVARKTV